MRTLVVSDLHLGAGGGVDVLRHPTVADALLAALEDVDRLILLGDTLELRETSVHVVLDRARPVLERIGERMGGREIVLVPGNHDHGLGGDWLARQREPALDQRTPAAEASFIGAACARMLAPARVEIAYPGVWLTDRVYATHGHYLDVHMTVPTLERLAIAASGRLALSRHRRWDDARSPADYEAVLTPVYAWAHAVAQSGHPSDSVSGGRTVAAWNALRPGGRRALGARALSRAFPFAVRALNAAGLGPLRSEISLAELRRAGLRAMSEVVQRLEVEADHVIFGHTHRAGALPDDFEAEWLTPNGVRLHNTGSWVYSATFCSGPESPYWPGNAIVVEEGAAPRLLRLLTQRTAAELSGGREASVSPAPARA